MSKPRKITYLCILWLVIGTAIWATQSPLMVSKPVALVPVPMTMVILGGVASVIIWRTRSKS